jgi:hypothetical protein
MGRSEVSSLNCFEAVAEAGGGRGGLEVLEALDAGGHVIDAIEAGLERSD